ncbi:hypothetical protein XFPR_12040 (plasmid) [Xylella fastidiosa]|uniref:LPD7 domain-containing protein n=2 Tax=Xylella fastidiosa TaxID=2371 RepID=UPI0003D33760|nr:LPD7 domain-containing protein [Xylella fastidiosa]ALR05472.1 hypothetical protein XFPR_12040 [Xylella fastidiosa]OJZ69108.1 hypothetical protein B375_0211650 [Xylella fastidiosa 6c]
MNDEIQNQGFNPDPKRLQLAIAIDGAKELVSATKIALKYGNSNHLDANAYIKLAAVDFTQANALVEAERDRLPDGILKDSIRLDEAQFAAAISELEDEANAERNFLIEQSMRLEEKAYRNLTAEDVTEEEEEERRLQTEQDNLNLYKGVYSELEAIAAKNVARANLFREQMAKDGAKELTQAAKISLMASFSDDYQSRNREKDQASRLEEDAYRKLAAVDVAQANALVEVEREKISDELLKGSIRLNEAKLLANMRDLNPELYKAEQQRRAAEPGTKEHRAAENETKFAATYEHLHNEDNKERLEKNSSPILRGAMAIEGAKLLVSATEKELEASFSEDAGERDFLKEMSLSLEDDAYTKLANVDVAQANALVAAERRRLPDGELKDWIRFDEAKFAAAIRELNPETDKAKAIESRAEQGIAVEKETKKPTVIEAAKQLVEATKTAMMAGFSKTVEAYHNAIEPNIEREQQQLSAEDGAKRSTSAWVKKAEPAQSVATGKASVPGNNLESDEIFTANQKDVKLVVPPEIEMQYLHVGEKFYHPKNTSLVAFEDKGNKLETKSNSEAIAQSMVRIAEARGWDEIKVSGSEVFRKEVWLEAASRGMHVKGYSPSEQDKAELAKRAASVKTNKVEQDNQPFRARENEANKTTATATPEPKVEAEKPESHNKKLAQVFALETPVEAVKKHPELAGAFAAEAAMNKKAESDGLTPEQLAFVAARVRQNVMNSIERGHIPQIKIKEEVEVKLDAKQEKELTR